VVISSASVLFFFRTGGKRMTVELADAHEPAEIASQIGACVLAGDLRCPSETGGWQLGDLDFSEYLDRCRDQRARNLRQIQAWI
jgi:hypothetical protein